MQLVIDIPEEVRVTITRMGLRRIPDDMAKIVDIAIQKGTPLPKGHWIHWAWDDECSECGWSTGKYMNGTKYCPGCGAKMENIKDTNSD